MKLEVHRTNLGTVFDPNKSFTSDKHIILHRHPEEPTEGATLGYLNKREDNFYKTADIKGQVHSTKILQILGPDLEHTDEHLILKDIHKVTDSGVVFDVDKYGRIVGVIPLKDEDLDDSVMLNWADIIDKPTTLEGYGITDLVPNDKNTEVTGKMSVEYQDKNTKSPVPYSHLTNKFYTSGYELKPGMMVIKLKAPDSGKWLQANGGVIYRKDYPEAVTFLAGASASQATLPDSREHDRILLETYGVDAKTYVFVG